MSWVIIRVVTIVFTYVSQSCLLLYRTIIESGKNRPQALHYFTFCFREGIIDVYYAVEYYVLDEVVINNGSESSANTTSRRRRRSTDDGADPHADLDVWYSMVTTSSQCRYWNPNYNDWSTVGCEVSCESPTPWCGDMMGSFRTLN